MSVNNLAVLLKDMGKYEEAELLYRQSAGGVRGGARSGASRHTEQRQ